MRNIMEAFQIYVAEHWVDVNDTDRGICIAALGLAGETGECVEHIKKYIRGSKPVNVDEFILELGDVLHYLVRLGQYYDLSLEDIAAANILKLDNRREERCLPPKVK